MSSGRVQGAEARGTHHVPSSSTVRRKDDNAKCVQNGEKRKGSTKFGGLHHIGPTATALGHCL